MRKHILSWRIMACILLSTTVLIGCDAIYDLPEDKDFISEDIKYNNTILDMIIGRTSMNTSLSAEGSSLPLSFEIVNARYGDGRPYTDIFNKVPTYEWVGEYDGLEKSLEEIEAKRKLVEKPIFEIDPFGRLILWGSSTNELLEPRPADTVLTPQSMRFFDVKVTNSGGTRIIKDLRLVPWRQRDYEPSTDVNPYTGGVAPDPIRPKDTTRQSYITPNYFTNIIGASSNTNMINNQERKDIVVYIRRFEGGNGKSLRFRFMDKDGQYINPKKFNETRWKEIVHGFNMEMTDEYVQYDVAYPIPLTNYRTSYNNGNRARSRFSYSRIGWGGTRTTAHLEMQYSIYKQGDWEIVFHFRNENPKFEDE